MSDERIREDPFEFVTRGKRTYETSNV